MLPYAGILPGGRASQHPGRDAAGGLFQEAHAVGAAGAGLGRARISARTLAGRWPVGRVVKGDLRDTSIVSFSAATGACDSRASAAGSRAFRRTSCSPARSSSASWRAALPPCAREPPWARGSASASSHPTTMPRSLPSRPSACLPCSPPQRGPSPVPASLKGCISTGQSRVELLTERCPPHGSAAGRKPKRGPLSISGRSVRSGKADTGSRRWIFQRQSP